MVDQVMSILWSHCTVGVMSNNTAVSATASVLPVNILRRGIVVWSSGILSSPIYNPQRS